MQIEVLGCAGGIGKQDNHVLRTTSFLLDDDILIDAGTGVGELSVPALCKINHIFITHSHLDHITSIPFLLDTVLGLREGYITVYALAETIRTLKMHIFNWKIWPDFSVIPSEDQPLLRYQTIEVGETVSLNARHITAIPANHVVPALGYHVSHCDNGFVFSGDSTDNDAFWDTVRNISNIKYLVVETAFCNQEKALAELSKHYCPSMLVKRLNELKQDLEVYITHLKPGSELVIMQQFSVAGCHVKALKNNQILVL